MSTTQHGSHTAPAAPSTALRHRKNVALLSSSQLQTLRTAFGTAEGISDDRGFGYWAGIHGLPLPMYCQHGTRLFLPWHRAYLYFFELALRDLAPDAVLAWWDWTSPGSHASGIPAAYTDRKIGTNPNPLFQTVVPAVARQGGKPVRTSRAPGALSDLPTPSDIQAVLALSDFLDFQSQLEEIHNAIHVWVGGTMGEIPWAAYDPVFFAHHTMIDRIWRLWQIRHPTPHLPDSLLTQALPPFPLTVAQTLDVKGLGYDYAATTTHTTQ